MVLKNQLTVKKYEFIFTIKKIDKGLLTVMMY